MRSESLKNDKTFLYPACRYNDAVECQPPKGPCETCGWNPEVAQKRLEETCRKLGIQYPLPESQKEEE